MGRRQYVQAGLALIGEDLEPRRNICIEIDNESITAIHTSASCPLERIGGSDIFALPQPGLGHVHSADHLFPEYGVDRNLKELVSPPTGLKHLLLERATEKGIIDAITRYYYLAWRQGLGLLVDFREGGGYGCFLAKKAMEKTPEGLDVVVLGRPGPEFPNWCDGLGLSSPLDYPITELRDLVGKYRPAMTHVAETPETRRMGDFELALDLGFDAVIHGTYLTREDLELLASTSMGLVICARSNLWHGLGIPPVREAFEEVPLVALGSDNAAWMTPSPWREAELALLLARLGGPTGDWLADKILRSLFITPYKLVGEVPRIIKEGYRARFLLYHMDSTGLLESKSIKYGIIKRILSGFIVGRLDDGNLSLL